MTYLRQVIILIWIGYPVLYYLEVRNVFMWFRMRYLCLRLRGISWNSLWDCYPWIYKRAPKIINLICRMFWEEFSCSGIFHFFELLMNSRKGLNIIFLILLFVWALNYVILGLEWFVLYLTILLRSYLPSICTIILIL